MCQIWIIWSEFILKIWVLNIYETEVIFIYIQNDIPAWKLFIFSINQLIYHILLLGFKWSIFIQIRVQ